MMIVFIDYTTLCYTTRSHTKFIILLILYYYTVLYYLEVNLKIASHQFVLVAKGWM